MITLRNRVRMATAIVVAQAVLATWVLAQPERPVRWGWQMFAGVATPWTIAYEDGTSAAWGPRPDLATPDRLARQLCRTDATIVSIEFPGGAVSC
jgi:hypothetical protein